ncbi:MAG: hypothetical protein LBU72_09905 [Burkholderiaceae bacterium]|nr:hypothetical protein [Burkholderiaceae bacterium]
MSLLIALVAAAPLPTLAQTSVGPDAGAAADTASAVLSQAAASAASAASAVAPNGDDDQAFEQWDTAERKRIADGRAAAQARYEQDRRDCWQRFAVNACLDRARDRRRAVLDALRHDELTLNAQERQRRTAARLDEIARKQAESAKRDADRNTNPPPASPASQVQ